MRTLTVEDTLLVSGGTPLGDTMIEAGDATMNAAVKYSQYFALGGAAGMTADRELFLFGATLHGGGVMINRAAGEPGPGPGGGTPGGTPAPGAGGGAGGGVSCSPGSTTWDGDHTVTYHAGGCTMHN